MIRVSGVTLPASISAASGQHLVHRAGLVDAAERAGAQVRLRGQGGVVGVVRRVVGQAEELTGPGVHHHGGARRAAGPLDGRAEDALGVPLHVAVDRQCDVLPAARLDGVVVPERDPVAAAVLVGRRAVHAGEQLVEHQLRALGGLAQVVHEADEVRPDVLGRVVADRVAPYVDALVALRLHLGEHRPRDRGGDPAGEVLELGVGLAQPLQQVEVVDGQAAGDDRRDLARVVLGHRGVGHEHQPVDRLGQRDAVAVGDRATGRREGDGDDALLLRTCDVDLRVDALELEEPRREHGEHHRDQDEADAEPQQRGAAPRLHDTTAAGRVTGTRRGRARPRLARVRAPALRQRLLPCWPSWSLFLFVPASSPARLLRRAVALVGLGLWPRRAARRSPAAAEGSGACGSAAASRAAPPRRVPEPGRREPARPTAAGTPGCSAEPCRSRGPPPRRAAGHGAARGPSGATAPARRAGQPSPPVRSP